MALEKLALPKERKVWQVEHGTIIFAMEREHPSFFVQIIDQYAYQREWKINRVLQDASREVWQSHMYRHPGRRHIHELSHKVCLTVMERLHCLLEKYPSLLFNATGDHETNVARPRHEGFVHFSERVLDGEPPQGSML